jgi:hypothetical protein
MYSIHPARKVALFRDLVLAVLLSVLCSLFTAIPTASGGYALEFDGVDDYVETPITDVPRDGTVEAWVNTTISDVRQAVISSHNGEEFRLHLHYRPGTGGATAGFLGLNVLYGTLTAYTDIGSEMYDGSWHHVAFVWEGGSPGTIRAYWDGQEKTVIYGTRGNWEGNYNRTAVHVIGREHLSNNNYFFAGRIDELRFWGDRARTESEIQEYMGQELIGDEVGLMGYWKFNEGEGTTAYDDSPNNNDGIIAGASWTTDAAPVTVGFAANRPSPPNGATDVPLDAILNWTPGIFAPAVNGHQVYLSENFNDVNDGMGGVPQSADSYDPGRLDLGTTYYWRVDEVNGAPDFTVFKGEVWSFTVEPKGLPIKGITATASSSHAENMGPENTVNGSGLNDLGQHATMPTEMWLSGAGVVPAWIQYNFDKVYKLDELLVWNSNQIIESFVGMGAKDVVIETSVDGAEWAVLEGATLLNQATGKADYTANTVIDFVGALVKSIRITINAGYGMLPQYGLSEVQFLYIPTFAREPKPAPGSVVDKANVELGWRSGREAASSEVYLGTDAADLALLGTTAENTYAASGLNYSTTYYWSVTEVNDAEAVTSYAGDVWSFTTPDFDTVDDFDQYDDNCNRIFFAWEDGLGHNGGEDEPGCDVLPSNGNGGGSIVGNNQAPFAERAIVNAGGSTQSLPLNYDNAFGQSEAILSVAGQDWTASAVQTLSLAVYGMAGNTGQLYVKINNSKVLHDGGAGSLTLEGWQIWNIDLSTVSGLQNVTSLTIGVDGANAAGMLYVDDIRLYPSVPEPITEWRVSASSDDAEEHDQDFGVMESLTSSDLEMPYEQSIDDAGHQRVGCRWAGIPIPQGATITEAWVQFSADSVGNANQDGAVSLVIEGQLSPDGAAFTSTAADISLRPKTKASVVWDVPVWTTTHGMGPDERTPDISSIIQEIVNQPGWAGQAIVLMFGDNPANPSQGYREAEAVDGEPDEAPLLHILYE